MSRFFAVLAVFLVASLVFTVGEPLAQQQPAPGAAPGAAAPAGQEKSVEGKIKSWDAATGMLTLDDGTQISVPATVKEREKIKEGASVKASYSVTGGKNVAKSIQVQ
jgi:Cu/Ag efflux protein CusF